MDLHWQINYLNSSQQSKRAPCTLPYPTSKVFSFLLFSCVINKESKPSNLNDIENLNPDFADSPLVLLIIERVIHHRPGADLVIVRGASCLEFFF
jgi:hypothetical protein